MGETPVFGVVQPGVDAVMKEYVHKTPIIIFATRATVKSGIYKKLLEKQFQKKPTSPSLLHWDESPSIFEQACPLLVPMIEEGWLDHPILHQTLKEYALPYAQSPPGIALLACTHYPWISSAFQNALPGWKIIQSSEAILDSIKDFCVHNGLLKSKSPSMPSRTEWIFTDPDALPLFAKKLILGNEGNIP